MACKDSTPITESPAADPPTVQVFVVMTPAHGDYWERFYENSNGWHTQFPGLRSYTFDHIAKDSLLRRANIFEIERLAGEKSEKHNNLLLAAFEQVWNDNNQSDWYFLAEDDTVIFKDNLLRLVQQLNPNDDIYMGRCVKSNIRHFGIIPYAIGGGGILMSRTLLQKMLPNVADCRSKYARIVYGDARVGACVNYSLDRPWGAMEACPPHGFSFANGESAKPLDDLIISLHPIKDPTFLRRLNGVAVRSGTGLTWKKLHGYIERNSS
jgi:hypothetical protein